MNEGVSVVFPAYNEEKTIAKTISYTLEILEGITSDYEIIVVDDASTDSTAKIIKEIGQSNKRIRLISHARNLKLGATLKNGFRAASKDLILYSDADMPFDMKELKKAIDILKKENADIVSAYRFDRDSEGLVRVIYSAIYNFLIKLIFGIKIRDVNFSFKLFKKSILDSVSLVSNGSFIMAEFLIKCTRKGFKIAQFGTVYTARSSGISRLFRPKAIMKILLEMLLFLFNYGKFKK